MEIIEHHPINRDIWKSYSEFDFDILNLILDNFPGKPNNGWELQKAALRYAIRAWLPARENESLLKYLRLSLIGGESHWWRMMNPGEASSIRWESWETRFFAPQNGGLCFVNYSYLESTLNLALILRDQRSIQFLSSIPLEKITSLSTIYEDEYSKWFLAAKQSILNGDGNGAILLKKAYQLTSPDLINNEAIKKTLHVVVPEMNLWVALLSRDEKLFNQYFLEAHTLFLDWLKLDEAWHLNPDYYFFENFLGVLSLASDNGIHLTEIESDYTPRWLIEKSF